MRQADASDAANAMLKLVCGHGPFRQAMFYDTYGHWVQNGYGNCLCYWACECCGKGWVICKTHGDASGVPVEREQWLPYEAEEQKRKLGDRLTHWEAE